MVLSTHSTRQGDRMKEVRFKPIGVIHTPFETAEGTPIQPAGAGDVRGTVVVNPILASGLTDLDGFSHIILLYLCHRAGAARLTVQPYMDAAAHGVFATRAPARPNPIGLSIVRLVRMEDNRIEVSGVDMLDGTPLLDIKPYVPAFDAPGPVRIGWLEDRAGQVASVRDDGRFAE